MRVINGDVITKKVSLSTEDKGQKYPICVLGSDGYVYIKKAESRCFSVPKGKSLVYVEYESMERRNCLSYIDENIILEVNNENI